MRTGRTLAIVGGLLGLTAGVLTAEPMKKRYIIDNDGSNLFWKSGLSDEDLRWAAAQCPKSVTTYMVCLGAGRFCYPCKVGELIPARMAPALAAAIERGEDPPAKLFEYLRKARKEVFITYRMNDVHNANDADDWNISGFRKQHPECIVGVEEVKKGKAEWMSYCLDYARPEVRAYVLSSLADMAGRYDVEGFQLDWMRFPRHLSGGTTDEVWAKRGHLTEFLVAVRRMLDEVGGRRGKRILLAVRVPTTPEGCRRLGADVAEWASRKAIDFVSLAPFLSCDFRMPIEEFRKMTSGNPIPIYAGTDLNHSGRCHTAESYRGWALSVYDQGADGLNLFNFPCWTEYLGEQPYDWIADLDDRSKISRKPAMYTLVSNHHRSHVDPPTVLPVTVQAGKRIELPLYLPKAAVAASRALLLIAADGEAGVSLNGAELRNPRKAPSGNIFLAFLNQENLPREPKVEHCRVWMVSPNLLRGGDNVVRISNTGKADVAVTRVDLGVWQDE